MGVMLQLVSLYSFHPVTDWANSESRKIAPITISSELPKIAVRQPPTRAQVGAPRPA